MIKQKPFSITLASNASAARFPDNTTSRFSNVLPERIVLQGEWEMALTKIRYPVRFYNLSDRCRFRGQVYAFHTAEPRSPPMEVDFALAFDDHTITSATALVDKVNECLAGVLENHDVFFLHDAENGTVAINPDAVDRTRYVAASASAGLPAPPRAREGVLVENVLPFGVLGPPTEDVGTSLAAAAAAEDRAEVGEMLSDAATETQKAPQKPPPKKPQKPKRKGETSKPPATGKPPPKASQPAAPPPPPPPPPPPSPATPPNETKFLIHSLFSSPNLAKMLGFEPGTDLVEAMQGKYAVDPYRGFPHEMFVYCNLVAPQMVGDTFAQIVDSTAIEFDSRNDRLARETSFYPLNWVSLLQQDFRVVNVDLRDGQGELLPFAHGFSSTLVLSFRPKTHRHDLRS